MCFGMGPALRRVAAIGLVVLVAGCGSGGSSEAKETSTTIPSPSGPVGPWRSTFSDEFRTNSLDTQKWATCYPYGTVGCTNAGNNELQWYVPDGISVREGRLKLTARKQAIESDSGKTFDYTSGMVTTGPESTKPESPAKYKFTYGYVEARIKAPAGRGLWPAVWLLPTDDPWPPEIDAVEVLGDDPTTAHLALHWEGPNPNVSEKSQYTSKGADLSSDFHTFGVDWQPDSVTWYQDGTEVARFTDRSKIPNEPMYLLANLAVGGKFPGSPDSSTGFPATYEVDWVRVWQRQ